jgi:membrane protease YdiL (CAAX protease family)
MKANEKSGQIINSAPLLIVLHLLPGILFAVFFIVLSRLFIQHGLTGYLALLITIPICLAPVEIGIILFWRNKFEERRSLSDVIGYRQKGTLVEYVVLPLLFILFWGTLSIVISPITQYFEANLSEFLPAWIAQEALLNGLIGISPAQVSITLVLAILSSGFVAPIVEEMYFRGFLLSRMERWRWAAPIINSFLFAVYHFYFPGNVPGIFVAFLPISYVVRIKKNWRVSAITHSMFNLWGVYSVFTFLSKAA